MKKIKVFKYQTMNEANSYLLINNHNAILIDGGFNAELVEKYLQEHNLKLTNILFTHFHADHVAGLDVLAKKYHAMIHINNKDFKYILNQNYNGSKRDCLTDYTDPSIHFDKFTKSKIVQLNGFKINFIPVGGHTPGSTFYAVDDAELFVGDTLFKNGLGFHNAASANLREELKKLLKQTCNDEKFFNSIKLIIKEYKSYKIHPGHWQESFLVEEVLNNADHPVLELNHNF